MLAIVFSVTLENSGAAGFDTVLASWRQETMFDEKGEM